MNLFELANDVKVAAVVAGTTAGTGTISWFKWSPDGIIQIATLFGILAGSVLSVSLIIFHWRKNRVECKKIELQIFIMKTKEKERIEAAKKERRRISDLKNGVNK